MSVWPAPTGLPCCLVPCAGLNPDPTRGCFCVTLNLPKRRKRK